MRNILLVTILSITTTFSLFSADTSLAYTGDSGYTLVERTNLRRYVNGKYSGLTSREVRSFISKSNPPQNVPRSARLDRWYKGNFFVMEETLRSAKAVTAGIHEAIPSVFRISPDGKMTMIEDNGYPSFRSFPTYTTEKIKVGDSWKGMAERAVDPMNKGIFTRIPILVRYTFDGEEVYKGENVYRIKAIWQTNYGFSNYDRDPKGDDSLKQAMGGHKADIIVRAATGEAILITDQVDETFTYSDGSQVNFKGTITLFTEYPPAIDRNKLIHALNRIAKADTSPKANESSVSSASFPPSSSDFSGGSQVASAKNYSNGGGASSSSSDLKGGSKVASAKNIASSNPSSISSSSTFGNLKKDSLAQADTSGIDSPVSTGAKNSDLRNKIASSKSISSSSKNDSGDSSDSDKKSNMVYEETPAGIRLSVRDIKFKADSDEVLGSEKSRLDEIASVLKLAPDSQFLIEGHTANVGKPAGEQKLSEERAKKIAGELAARGIAADRFICKGLGGRQPVASNDTNQGRAQNRRVEITILE